MKSGEEICLRDLLAYTPVEYSPRTSWKVSEHAASATDDMALPASPPASILASVYSQSWPTPSFFRTIRGAQQLQCPNENGVRPNKEWVKEQLVARTAADRNNQFHNHVTSGCVPSAGDKLLTPRLRSGSNSSPGSTGEAVNADQTDSPAYKLTTSDYRRLTNQVQEAGVGLTNGFKGTTFRGRFFAGSCPRHPRTGRPHTAPDGTVYKSQLASSLKAFQDKSWVPYEPPTDSVTESRPGSRCSRSSSRLQSRPVSGRSVMRPTSGQSFVRAEEPHLIQLQVKSSLRNTRIAQDTAPAAENPRPQSSLHSYDSLDPDVVYELSGGVEAESVYGDRPDSVLKPLQDDGASDSDDDDVSDKKEVTTKEGDGDKDSDDSDEDYPEPSVDEAKLTDVPELHLRPEKLDSLYIPEMRRGDRRKYDFDASKVNVPEYAFSECLSDGVFKVNLQRDCVVDGKPWRELAAPEDDVEACIMDRLVELSRLDAKTGDWETSRREKLRLARQRQAARNRMGAGRISSAKTWREKKCCTDCLQLLCTGDCPEKRSSSSQACCVCGEPGCPGQCSVNMYAVRSRHERETGDIFEDKPKPRPKLRPRSCTSCQKRHNAKLINANNIMLGRPQSSQATFNYGQVAYKPCQDLRPNTRSSVTQDLEENFEKLGMELCKPEEKCQTRDEENDDRPATACSHDDRRIKGRASSLPHKSYFSQRRNSLTESVRERMRIAALRKRNTTAGKKRRPKTPG